MRVTQSTDQKVGYQMMRPGAWPCGPVSYEGAFLTNSRSIGAACREGGADQAEQVSHSYP